MNKVRLLVVDDSYVSRKIIIEILAAKPEIEVIGEAENGAQAVEMVKDLKPDIVTMDLNMPVMGGLESIERIMAKTPTPILVISSIDDAKTGIAAVSRGALELFSKEKVNPEQGAELIEKILFLARIKVIRHIGLPNRKAFNAEQTRRHSEAADSVKSPVVAIASSTGGPDALVKIFNALKADFSMPIVLAQHISIDFSAEMVRWLNNVVHLTVVMGEAGRKLERGHIYVSPSDKNMGVDSDGVIYLQERDPGDIYFPSCDYLLTSIAYSHKKHSIGVILTGMGRDGVEGIGAIKEAGGLTIAQNEETCVIYGMPKIAIESGHIDRVLSLDEIIKKLNGIGAA